MASSPSRRKRHSAFEDFPVDNSQQVEPETQIEAPTLRQKPPEDAAAKLERIERLRPSQMIPDRFQPRRLLPASLRGPFFDGQISCYQAAERWLSMARQDDAHMSEIERLLAMGESFEDHGQIKPITGSWIPATDGRYMFQIETGERRFWAACLTAVTRKLDEEPLLRVEVVENPSRQRQVLENRHAEAPSAVSQACEVASLILAEMGIEPGDQKHDEYDYFRMARSQRMPAGLWDKIKPVMQLTRPRMVQLLNILQLPSAQLDLADRYRLPERVLREILSLPGEQWEHMLLLSIQSNLTSEEVVELSTAKELTATSAPVTARGPKKSTGQVAAIGLRRFSNALHRLDEINQSQALDEIADDLMVSGEAGGVLALLEDLSQLLIARLNRR
jgi:hypothetical protein